MSHHFNINSSVIVGLLLTVFLSTTVVADVPSCDFGETVDLTGSTKFPNGSYEYKGTLIPANLVGIYNIDQIYNGNTLKMSQKRGCICRVKNCVRFCCAPDEEFSLDFEKCVASQQNKNNNFIQSNITVQSNSGRLINKDVLGVNFVQVIGKPCESLYLLDDIIDEDRWQLFENGSLYRYFDEAMLSRDKYCLQPVFDKVDSIYKIKAFNCAIIKTLDNMDMFELTLKQISIVFLLFTIIIYLVVPELRDLNGKCFVSYLIALLLTYLMLAIQNNNFGNDSCKAVGYTGYFAISSVSLWLLVLSYQLWLNSHSSKSHNEPWLRFEMYSIVAWGGGGLITLYVVLVDMLPMDDSWKPSVGVYTCWINTNTLFSALFYLYGPMTIMLLLDLVFFVLIAINMRRKKSVSQIDLIPADENPMANVHPVNMSLYYGVIFSSCLWSIETIIFFTELFVNDLEFLSILNIIICAQGIIIFAFFVLKPSVLGIVLKWFRRKTSPDSNFNISLKSTYAQQMSFSSRKELL